MGIGPSIAVSGHDVFASVTTSGASGAVSVFVQPPGGCTGTIQEHAQAVVWFGISILVYIGGACSMTPRCTVRPTSKSSSPAGLTRGKRPAASPWGFGGYRAGHLLKCAQSPPTESGRDNADQVLHASNNPGPI